MSIRSRAQHARRRSFAWHGVTVALGALLLVACGVSGVATQIRTSTRSRPSPHLLIVVRSAAASSVDTSQPRATETVSCQPGEQMIGGGFSTGDVFEYAVFALADYPSGPASWTVTVGSISQFALTAEVYCAPASPALGVQIARATISGAGSVNCPAGATLLGGGFSGGDQAATSSRPATTGATNSPTGWNAAVDGAGAQVYALCAGQHVSAPSVTTASFNPHSSASSQQPASGSVPCPAGTTATGGGFDGSLIVSNQVGTSANSGWSVEAGGDNLITVYALCAQSSA